MTLAKYLVVFAAVGLLACPKEVEQPTQKSPCERACANFMTMNCEAGFDPDCVTVCERNSALRHLPVECWATAKTVAELKSCGSIRRAPHGPPGWRKAMSHFLQKAIGFVAAPVVGSVVAAVARSPFRDANTRFAASIAAHGATAIGCYIAEGKLRDRNLQAIAHGGVWGEGIHTGAQAIFGGPQQYAEVTVVSAPASTSLTSKISQALNAPEARVLLSMGKK